MAKREHRMQGGGRARRENAEESESVAGWGRCLVVYGSEHMCVKTFLSRNVKLEKGGNTLEEKGMASGGISRWCAELTLSLQRPGGAGAASLAVAHRSRDWGLSQSFLAMGLTEVQLCVTGRVTLSDLVACWCAVFSCFV